MNRWRREEQRVEGLCGGGGVEGGLWRGINHHDVNKLTTQGGERLIRSISVNIGSVRGVVGRGAEGQLEKGR